MVKLFSVKEMQALEKEANENGLTYDLMMQNAGKGLAEEILSSYSHVTNKKILALVGSGNNGGDALVALQYLSRKKWITYAYIVKKREVNDPLVRSLIDAGGEVIVSETDIKYKKLEVLLTKCSIVIDGIFGTGIKLPLRGEIKKILQFVKTTCEKSPIRPQVVAVDCPSGVDCESGEVAPETIPADITVTMAGVKNGLIMFPAAKFTGELRVASIGQISEFQVYKDNTQSVLTSETVKRILPDRPLDSHKGTFGTAFIIAGSVNYTGAALLSGKAAYRSGVGLVTMGVPVPLHDSLAGQFPESTWILLPHELGVISADAARIVQNNINRATAILIGPGFGLEDTTKEFLHKLFSDSSYLMQGDIGFIHESKSDVDKDKFQKPVVLDADGLKLMSKIPGWMTLIPSPAVLTPHPGEMSVISGMSIKEIQSNRIEITRQFSQKWGHVIVLKGAYTVIGAPDGRIAVVPIATPALARAGTGDVLAGIIVGLRAQGVSAFDAACAGAWIHATAGVITAKHMGNTISIMAGDVLDAIPYVMSNIQ